MLARLSLEARRYYVQHRWKIRHVRTGSLKKAAGLEIRMICPLHSVIWREDLPWLIDKYLKWKSIRQQKSVTIVTICHESYGKKLPISLPESLPTARIRHISVFGRFQDPSVLHHCRRVPYLRRLSLHPSPTMAVSSAIWTLLHQLAAHGLAKRTAALIQNGTWAATTSKQMGEILGVS